MARLGRNRYTRLGSVARAGCDGRRRLNGVARAGRNRCWREDSVLPAGHTRDCLGRTRQIRACPRVEDFADVGDAVFVFADDVFVDDIGVARGIISLAEDRRAGLVVRELVFVYQFLVDWARFCRLDVAVLVVVGNHDGRPTLPVRGEKEGDRATACSSYRSLEILGRSVRNKDPGGEGLRAWSNGTGDGSVVAGSYGSAPSQPVVGVWRVGAGSRRKGPRRERPGGAINEVGPSCRIVESRPSGRDHGRRALGRCSWSSTRRPAIRSGCRGWYVYWAGRHCRKALLPEQRSPGKCSTADGSRGRRGHIDGRRRYSGCKRRSNGSRAGDCRAGARATRRVHRLRRRRIAGRHALGGSGEDENMVVAHIFPPVLERAKPVPEAEVTTGGHAIDMAPRSSPSCPAMSKGRNLN